MRVTSDSHFGWLRTRLSVERTMMSWIRTAVSLIGFGFAIVQFFERFEQMAAVRTADYPKAPQYLGLALIASGSSPAARLDLAISLDGSLYVERSVHFNCRHANRYDEGANAISRSRYL